MLSIFFGFKRNHTIRNDLKTKFEYKSLQSSLLCCTDLHTDVDKYTGGVHLWSKGGLNRRPRCAWGWTNHTGKSDDLVVAGVWKKKWIVMRWIEQGALRMWCVFIWGLHGKHCVVPLMHVCKSSDVIGGGGVRVSWWCDYWWSLRSACGESPPGSCAVYASRCVVCCLCNTLFRLHRIVCLQHQDEDR